MEPSLEKPCLVLEGLRCRALFFESIKQWKPGLYGPWESWPGPFRSGPEAAGPQPTTPNQEVVNFGWKPSIESHFLKGSNGADRQGGSEMWGGWEEPACEWNHQGTSEWMDEWVRDWKHNSPTRYQLRAETASPELHFKVVLFSAECLERCF